MYQPPFSPPFPTLSRRHPHPYLTYLSSSALPQPHFARAIISAPYSTNCSIAGMLGAAKRALKCTAGSPAGKGGMEGDEEAGVEGAQDVCVTFKGWRSKRMASHTTTQGAHAISN